MGYMIHFILYRMSSICHKFESTGYKYLYNLIFFLTQFAFRFKFYSNKGGNQIHNIRENKNVSNFYHKSIKYAIYSQNYSFRNM